MNRPVGIGDDLARVLLGSWALDRRIVHRSGPGRGPGTVVEVRGRASWVALGSHRLRYDEQVVMTIDGRSFAASRAYHYRLPAASDGPVTRAEVSFDDGRFFHHLELSSGHCAIDHLCGDDHYRGEVVFDGRALHQRWDVTGPAKDYRSDTVLSPPASPVVPVVSATTR